MIGYYCKTINNLDLFFIPWVLAGRETNSEMRYYHNTEVLEELVLAMKDGRINRFQLESKGWEISEFEIPDIYVKSFIDACSKKWNKNKEKILKFSEEIYSTILELVEEEEKMEECYEDEEDYADDWWKRGENPSCQ